MDTSAATIIGVSLILGAAAIGAAIGAGIVASKTIEGITRQPWIRNMLLGQMFLSIAILESFPFIAFGIAMWLLLR